MRRPIYNTLCAAAFLLLTHADVAHSQSPVQPQVETPSQSETAPNETAPEAPQSIAAADIAAESEKVTVRLREIDKLATASNQIEDLERHLAGILMEIDRIRAGLSQDAPASLRSIAAAHGQWNGLGDQLKPWQDQLQKRSTALQKAHDELEATQQVWEASRSADLPATVSQQIDSLLAETKATYDEVSQRIAAVLTLQSKVGEARAAVSTAIAQLDDLESELRSRIFVLNRDPIWIAIQKGKSNLASEIIAARDGLMQTLTHYVSRFKKNAAIHVGIFVVLTVLIVLIRRQVPAGVLSDVEMQRTAIVLQRPFSTALLVSVVFVRLIYPITSTELIQMARFVALLPLLRLLPQILPKFHSLIYILAFVYVTDIAGQLAPEGSLFQRLILLSSMTLAVVALGVALRTTHRMTRDPQDGRSRVAGGLFWLAAIILVISLVANIVGGMALSGLLGNAMFNVIWSAVVLKVLIRLASGLLTLVLRSSIALRLQSVRNCGALIYGRVLSLLTLTSVLTLIWLALGWLQIRQSMATWVVSLFQREWSVGSITISLNRIAAFVLTLIVAVILSKLTRFFLEQDVLSRMELPRGAAATVSTLVNYVVIGVGIVIAFVASGITMSSLGFVVGALSVGIGFGLQNIVKNFVSGLILIFERPVKVGDLVEVGGTMGNITRIGARSCTLKSFDGAEVIVPNGNFIDSEVINWTLSDERRRLQVSIPVALGSDSHRVTEILVRVAKDHPEILDDPEPWSAFEQFTEFGMMFILKAWPAEGAMRAAVQTDLVASSIAALKEAGIEVPRPQREVFMRKSESGASDP